MNPLAFIVGNWQRFVLYAVVVVVLLGAAWLHGYSRGEIRLYEYQAKQATATVAVARARDVVTERVVMKYIKVREGSADAANAIRREVVRYVEANPGYCLDAPWGELHDAAAERVVPHAAGRADGARRAPTAAGALEAVTENYEKHNACADRLDALQEWVREQSGVEELGVAP